MPTKEGMTNPWNHPFWVIEKKAWVETKDLEEGDRVLLSNGKEVAITRIEPYPVDATKVYNFEVEDNHTYFVGEDGVLVHNYTIQVGLSGSAATFLGFSGEKGFAASISLKGIEFDTYSVKPGNKGKTLPSGHSDAGVSGSVNISVSENESLLDLNGDSITIGGNYDVGPANLPFPSPQIGWAVNTPIDSNAKPSFTGTIGLSYSVSPIDQYITPSNTKIGSKKNESGVCGFNMSCIPNKNSYGCGVIKSCIP
ncbi:MAG: polymorphic toxin-type HINT domain-containing protein [Leptospiraceae bacterium]|jgi:hypothetical protein|nr:polymorphic toxin-type HINT domain-containing protein [Leptospiraceae bacterium]MCZ8348016.1 polymorphic toxin-type HINT domain-containing protein [Leptospiraceae bacterium]